jgi:UDP-2-acetamido-3-amino-2,3-dideoxy-glucuronate N-acetyltransferase
MLESMRLGVVGAGYWGPNLIRVCSELGVLGSICDTNTAVLESLRAAYPGVALEAEFDGLLSRQLDGVIIAAPAHLHAQMCLKAIAAGKHVLVEKPLALTLEEGERIAAAARQARVTVFVGHLLLYHPAVKKMRSLLNENVIGDVWHLRSRRLSLGKLRSRENVWWSFAPHDVAVMLAIMGNQFSSVRASHSAFFRPSISDAVYADFTFSANRTAHIEVCWLDPDKSARIDVFGSTGAITFKDSRDGASLTMNRFQLIQNSDGTSSVQRDISSVVAFGPGEPLREEIKAFLEAVESGKEPESSAEAALPVLKALAMADQAAAYNEIMGASA